MQEFADILSALGSAFSDPHLYLLSLALGIIYVMYKQNNEDKKDVIDRFSSQLDKANEQLEQAQITNASFAKTIEVQMAEHRHAIEQITVTIKEMRKELKGVKIDFKDDYNKLSADIRRLEDKITEAQKAVGNNR